MNQLWNTFDVLCLCLSISTESPNEPKKCSQQACASQDRFSQKRAKRKRERKQTGNGPEVGDREIRGAWDKPAFLPAKGRATNEIHRSPDCPKAKTISPFVQSRYRPPFIYSPGGRDAAAMNSPLTMFSFLSLPRSKGEQFQQAVRLATTSAIFRYHGSPVRSPVWLTVFRHISLLCHCIYSCIIVFSQWVVKKWIIQQLENEALCIVFSYPCSMK